MACQRQILAEGGSLGGDLKSCLRDLQFIQPRFESFVTPRRRYVCLVKPLALVLAVKAGDARLDASIRRRPEHALASMSDAKDVFAAGLAGDYGEVCLEFLRGFDVHDHDPATTGREVEDFTRGLRRLFVDGHVVRVPDGADSVLTPGSASTPAAQEPRQKTLTQIALAAVRHRHSRHGPQIRKRIQRGRSFGVTRPIAGIAEIGRIANTMARHRSRLDGTRS